MVAGRDGRLGHLLSPRGASHGAALSFPTPSTGFDRRKIVGKISRRGAKFSILNEKATWPSTKTRPLGPKPCRAAAAAPDFPVRGPAWGLVLGSLTGPCLFCCLSLVTIRWAGFIPMGDARRCFMPMGDACSLSYPDGRCPSLSYPDGRCPSLSYCFPMGNAHRDILAMGASHRNGRRPSGYNRNRMRPSLFYADGRRPSLSFRSLRAFQSLSRQSLLSLPKPTTSCHSVQSLTQAPRACLGFGA